MKRFHDMTPDEQAAVSASIAHPTAPAIGRPQTYGDPRPATVESDGKPGAGSYIAAVLIPIVGAVLAIVQFSRGNTGPGAALLLTAIVAGFVYFVIFTSVAVGGYEACLDQARTIGQMAKC